VSRWPGLMSIRKTEQSRYIARLVIVLLVAVCILGLLILPKVNPDNFVVNGQTPLKTFVTHAQTLLTSPVFTFPTRTYLAILPTISRSSGSIQSTFESKIPERIANPLLC
jgi:amino acid permease